MILQLNPTIPLDTDKGPADAKFLFDYSEEHKVMFGVFVRETGEFWVIPQDKVRLEKNITGGVRCGDKYEGNPDAVPLRELDRLVRAGSAIPACCPECGEARKMDGSLSHGSNCTVPIKG